MKIRVEFKPQDLWIGAFWKSEPLGDMYVSPGARESLRAVQRRYRFVDLWICMIPCIPIHISWIWKKP